MNIIKKPKDKKFQWTDEDIDFLKQNYSNFGSKRCSEHLQRSQQSVKAKAHRLKIKKSPVWTAEHLDFLKNNYKKLGTKKCGEILNKSPKSVATKINQIYGNQNKLFTEEEIIFVKENYETNGGEWCAKKIEKTPRQIIGLATRLNLKVDKKTKHMNMSIKGKERRKRNLDKIKSDALNYSVNSPLISYILGFIWGDGYLRDRKNENSRKYCIISILEEDGYEIVDILIKIKIKHSLSKINQKNRRPQLSICITDKIFNEFLNINDYSIKSEKPPIKILDKIPEKFKNNFLHGLSDADGCFYVKEKICYQFSISGSYEYNWAFVEDFFKKCEINMYQVRPKIQYKKDKCSSIRLSNKKEIQKLIKYMYSDKNLIGLTRKYKKTELYF